MAEREEGRDGRREVRRKEKTTTSHFFSNIMLTKLL